MTEDDVTEFYGKDIQNQFGLQFINLNHTGSADDRENQVIVLTVPESVFTPLRETYRRRDLRAIKDFEYIRNPDGTVDLYFGGSYGAKALLGAVGQILYYSDF